MSRDLKVFLGYDEDGGWQKDDNQVEIIMQLYSFRPAQLGRRLVTLKKMFCFPFLLFWIQQSFLCPLLLLCTFVQGKSKGIKSNQWTLIHNKASHPLALGGIVLLSNIIHPKWCYWQANVLLVLRGHSQSKFIKCCFPVPRYPHPVARSLGWRHLDPP